jgi:predicted ATPase/DNA-binding CsgD family transcriptional regulator
MHLPELGKPFVGRQRELDELLGLLSQRDKPLITVTGFGGFGKTTLALEAARRIAVDFEHGAAFVSLAAVTDHRLVATQIARALGLADAAGGRAPEQALVEHLAGRELLLVLDTFEHVMDARMLVSELLAACPTLVVLVTSRRALKLSKENILDLEPMSLPAPGHDRTAAAVRGSEAVLLFGERAKAVRGDFEIDDRNARQVAEICRTLEGIPLAIELAAARTRAIGTRDLLRHLKPRLGIVASGPVDQDLRHQALGEMIAWSYDLLTPTQQRLFRRLCVFVDGFSVDGALWVGVVADDREADDAAPIGAASVSQRLLDDIGELEASHLIRFRRQPDGSSQYETLETIIEFGLRQMSEPETVSARWAHVRYALDLATRAEQGLRDGDAAEWMAILERELSNLRAAIRWLLDRGNDDGARVLRLCNALWPYWRLRGSWIEAIGWLEAAIQAGRNQRSGPLAAAWLNLGNSIFDDQRRAQWCYRNSLSLFESLEDAGGIAVAVGNLAMLADMMGEYVEGKRLAKHALGRLRALGRDVRGSIVTALIVTADLEINGGHPGNARPLLVEALSLCHDLSDEQHVAVVLWRLGRVERLVGHPNEAVDYLAKALAALRQRGDRNLEYMALSDLGMAQLAAERCEAAMAAFAASLAIARELQIDDGTVAGVLEGLARLRMAHGRIDDGVRIYAVAAQIRERSSTPIPQIERDQYRRDLKSARRALRTRFESQWMIGGTASLEEVVALALSPLALDPLPQPSVVAKRAKATDELTDRELVAVCELVKGKSDREIAAGMGVSLRTVHTFLGRARNKLGVDNRVAAATKAIDAGWCIETSHA